jgi:hypothetical protein
LFSKLFKIEDLSIEDNAVTLLLIPHGLISAFCGIDDGKAPVAEADPIVGINVLEVGAPFFQCHGGSRDVHPVEFSYKIKRKYAGDSAHE